MYRHLSELAVVQKRGKKPFAVHLLGVHLKEMFGHFFLLLSSEMGKRCLSSASAKSCLPLFTQLTLPRGSLVNQTPEVNRRHHRTRMLEPAMGPSP